MEKKHEKEEDKEEDKEKERTNKETENRKKRCKKINKKKPALNFPLIASICHCTGAKSDLHSFMCDPCQGDPQSDT